jgi:hypothetical protein
VFRETTNSCKKKLSPVTAQNRGLSGEKLGLTAKIDLIEEGY